MITPTMAGAGAGVLNKPAEAQEKKAKVYNPPDDDEEIKRDQYAFYRKY